MGSKEHVEENMKYIISVNSKRFIGEKLVEMASESLVRVGVVILLYNYYKRKQQYYIECICLSNVHFHFFFYSLF